MNVHSFSIKNIFYDKMDIRLFYFDVSICKNKRLGFPQDIMKIG